MNRADRIVDQAADRLQALADQSAGDGGFMAKLAAPLADDAAFIRQLKPSLIRARIRGELPTDLPPHTGHVTPSSPKPATTAEPGDGDGGINPFVVIGVALVAGIVLAKVIDRRGRGR